MMVAAVLSLGSNLGESWRFLQEALIALEQVPALQLRRLSSYYATRPWSPPMQRGKGGNGMLQARAAAGQHPAYLNQVVLLETSLPPRQLLELCFTLEARFGRPDPHVRSKQREAARWSARYLDIDLILYGKLRCQTQSLTLPHPRVAERLFVLRPLVEIWPAAPFGKRTAQQLLARCPDKGQLWKCISSSSLA